MPSKKKYDHIHQYQPSQRPGIYRCIILNCPHYIRKEYLLNKITRCAHCGTVFTITQLLFNDGDLDVCCMDCKVGRSGLAARLEAVLGAQKC